MNSVTKSVLHAAVSVLLFAIPIVVANTSGWQDLTLGGILNFIYLHLVVLKQDTPPAAAGNGTAQGA